MLTRDLLDLQLRNGSVDRKTFPSSASVAWGTQIRAHSSFVSPAWPALRRLLSDHKLTPATPTDAKKSGVKESVFKALEPVSQADRSKGGGGHRFLNFGKNSPDWFRAHKEFFMPTLVCRAESRSLRTPC